MKNVVGIEKLRSDGGTAAHTGVRRELEKSRTPALRLHKHKGWHPRPSRVWEQEYAIKYAWKGGANIQLHTR